ncbi:GNAT family N-acetyltransferase [Paenibacillus tarimensis]|nr:GNAT family N-acetyltransferase [Paenibacillus tarimensis]
MIRKPTELESADCIKLIYMSGPELFSYFFIEREPEVYRYINVFYTKPDVMFSSENVWVKVENDKVCGLLLSLPSKVMKQTEKNMMKYGKELTKTVGLRNSIRMMLRSGLQKYLTSVNHDDEYYICNLAVSEAYRGRGFGVELLHKAEELAKEQGFSKISLAVELRNSDAKRIYEKFGFRQTAGVEFPRKYHKHSIDGFYKMVKILE